MSVALQMVQMPVVSCQWSVVSGSPAGALASDN